MSGAAARWLARAFTVAATASLGCAIGFDIWARSLPSVEQNAMFIADTDSCIARLLDTDVFVRMENLPASENGLMRAFYYRGNFSAYPQRMLMSDPRVAFDYRHEPSTINFAPTVSWLLAHDIGGKITLGLDRNGQFSSKLERIVPSER